MLLKSLVRWGLEHIELGDDLVVDCIELSSRAVQAELCIYELHQKIREDVAMLLASLAAVVVSFATKYGGGMR